MIAMSQRRLQAMVQQSISFKAFSLHIFMFVVNYCEISNVENGHKDALGPNIFLRIWLYLHYLRILIVKETRVYT